MRLDDLDSLALFAIVMLVIYGTSLHEMGHAFTAYWLGDPTPGKYGRLTFNPIPHLSPVLTAVILPLFMFMTHNGLLALASTPVTPSRFKRPLSSMALVAVAGPVMNVLFAGLLVAILWIPGVARNGNYAFPVLAYGAYFNFMLALFNLVPLPGLDGYSIVRGLLPIRTRQTVDGFARTPMALVLVMVLGGGIFRFISGPTGILFNYLLPRLAP